jgi:hypothetical protein
MIKTSRVASGFDIELQLGSGWFRTALEMSLPENSLRVAIAGAASLRGQDLKALLE